MIPRHDIYFPSQRVSASEKAKAKWYANCIDYIIDAGLCCNDREDTLEKLDILHGNIPDRFYKKTLNPYNTNNEKYRRFPAVLRNFDIMTDIVRRYVSEYFKGVHEFTVGANNPEIVINKNRKLREEISIMAQQAFQQEFEKRYQELVQQSTQQGQDPNQIDPSQALPDAEEFMQNFEKNYIDKESKQAQDVLDYIRAMTKDTIIYLSAFFNYCALGECYTYCDIRDGEIFKENVPAIEAFPVPNGEFFVEDHDMFARRVMMSYQQIIDTFDEELTDKDRAFLDSYYSRRNAIDGVTRVRYDDYFENYADVCDKFSKEERELFRREPITVYDVNNDLYEVWHVVWRGEAKRGILKRVNQIGLVEEVVVDEAYKLNKEMGDISIEWAYDTQVYEGYRIGTRSVAIYPIKARPIAYNRKGKLPYNGIMELLPCMGKFSIIKLITPFQIMRNILIYHREMVIAKNKMLILLLPESLIVSNTEDKIYKMAADGVLIVDDSEDSNSQKMAQIRLLNANLGSYINDMTNLIQAVKLEAREIVDMNAQRYGEIAQSAGASTTQQSIAQSSMGSVIIYQMFDEFRKTDYNRDLDYAKLAFVDGLDTSYYDQLGKRRYLSLDVNSYITSDYSTTVRNNVKELDKLQQLKQWAFSAAQNGDLDMALAAIKGDNVTQITTVIEQFSELKRKHEADMQQAEQMLKQEELQNKIAEIQAKGDEDRKTEELKYYYELQLKGVDVNLSLATQQPDNTDQNNELQRQTLQSKENIERDKLNVQRQKNMLDALSSAADRQVKLHEIDTNLKIAKTNKNRYDK